MALNEKTKNYEATFENLGIKKVSVDSTTVSDTIDDGLENCYLSFESVQVFLGPQNVITVEPNLSGPPVELDDYNAACDRLLLTVSEAVAKLSPEQIKVFFEHPATVFFQNDTPNLMR